MIFDCLICHSFSFEIICKKCQKNFLKPEIVYKDGIISFYKYEEIDFLIKYKYKKFGDKIFKILANNSFSTFAKEYKEKVYAIPIDDNIKHGFSHTAILAKSLKSKYIRPIYSVLYSTNNFKYAGKSLQERVENPRNFQYLGPLDINVILVDDIVTTTLTINEAKEILQKYNVNVLFSVVLAR